MIHRSTLLILAWAVLGNTPMLIGARYAVAAENLIAQASTSQNSTAVPTVDDLSSQDLLNLQIRLQTLGYYNQAVDGANRADTIEALKRFQADAGLPDSGNLDATTIDQLQNPRLISQSSEDEADAPSTSEPEANSPDSEADESPSVTSDEDSQAVADTSEDDSESVGSEEPAGSDAGNADPETEPVEAERSNIRWLLWMVLAGIALAALGGGLVAFNRMSGVQAQDDDEDSDRDNAGFRARDRSSISADDTPSEITVNAEAIADQPPESVPESVPKSAPRNGHHPSANGNEPAAASARSSQNNASASSSLDQPTQRLAKRDGVESLIQDLEVSNPSKRKRAIWELGQRGNSSALQPLVTLLLDADSKERSLILAAVSEISVRTLKPMNRALAIAMQDENPEVRKNAIRDITRVYDLTVQAAKILGHVQTDTDPEVQATAQWALQQLNRLQTISAGSEQTALPSPSQSVPESLPEELPNQW
ncbi:MAG: peptidoglycan-binding protein [Cyanobacteria bacterium P01_C01_bin.73]